MLRRFLRILPTTAGAFVLAASLLGSAPSARALPPLPTAFPLAPLNGEGYAPLTPARLMDTRADAVTIDGAGSGAGAFGAGITRTLQVTGRGGVPGTGVEAVVLHITAVTPTVQTYVTVWPQGVARPTTSSLNPLAGRITSNLVISGVGPSGEVSLFNFAGSTDLIVDVVGWIPPGPTYESIVPHRVLDTRDHGRRVGPGAAIQVDLSSVPGFSTSGVSAVALNVTATEATAPTYLTVYPKGVARPITSNLNVVPARDVANMVVAELGDDGRLTIFNFSGSVHVVVDVLGWFTDGPGYTPIPAVRALDTRESSPVGPGSTITLDLDGRMGLPPAGLGAVVLNLTAVNATHHTFLTVFPDGSPLPTTSDLNPTPGSVIPNLVIAKVGPSGGINIYNLTGTIDVVVDIVGWLPSNVGAGNDLASVDEDAPATALPVLTNDVDHDGGPVLIQSVTQPANGTVAITGGGTGLTYAPDENYCNTPPGTTPDTFSYTLYGASTADVMTTVNCVDDAPEAVDDSATVAEDAAASWVDVLANDTDVDGGPINIASVTQPLNGIVFNAGDTLSYRPDGDYCNNPPGTAPDTFSYTLDGGSTATVSVTVNCADDAPTAVNDSATVAEDAAATAIEVLTNDTDVDAGPISIDSTTQPTNGTVVITGGGTGLTYEPDADYCNAPPGTTPDTFTYTLAPGGSTATVSATVNCVNDVPAFTKGADESVLEDAGAQSVSGWATAIGKGAANESGQTLTFEVTNNTNTGLFSVAPAVAADGTLSYTPAANANGTATITLRLGDDGGTANSGVDTSATQTFEIAVTAVNDVPAFTKGADESVLEDAGAQSVSGWATAIGKGAANESGQTLTFEVMNNTNTGLFSVAPAVAADGTLTYTPAANANGTATITLRLGDDGGTANSGVDTSATQTFEIAVTAVNDVPAFTKGADESVLEDAGAQSVSGWATAIGKGAANESGQTLTFEVTNNTNTGLFSVAPAVAADGTLSYTPADDANGTATITLRLGDDGGTANGGVDASATQSFEIAVTAVNDVPSFKLPVSPDQSVLEDSPQQTVAAFATDMSPGPADEAAQTLTFNVSNDNTTLFSGQPTIDETTGDLVYTPATGETGTATVTVSLSDNGGVANGGDDESASVTFDIVVFPPNFTPVADSQSGASAAVVVEDTMTTITLTATDGDDDDLTFTIVDSPSGVLGSLGAIDCTTTANTCTTTVSYTPVLNSNADDSFTFKVNDGTIDSSTVTVDVTITPVNDVPSFAKGANETVLEDAGAQSVFPWATGLSKGPANESAQTLSFEITNNTNSALFSAGPAVAADGTLTYTPADDANGTATITLRVKDNGGTANSGVDTSATQQFTITVTAVNDTPSFTKGADETVLEDAGAQSVSPWATAISAGPADEAGQTVSFGITNVTNSGLFSTGPAVAADGTLTYTPAANANGTSTITLRVTDGAGGADTSATQQFTITVTAVNDVPSFTKGADATSLEDAGAQTVDPWATGLSSGPADESSQTLSFQITGNDNAGLFSAGPAVSSTGVLTYTPAANANGMAAITLTISDDGGTANGGVATSFSQTFNIFVTGVNDAPSFDTLAGNPPTIAEDAGVQSVTGFATGMSKGPANESGESLTFEVTANTNADLFSAAPSILANGTLAYAPAVNKNGTATITIKLTDNGGTANGGDNDSATQQFTITVTATNDAPTSPGRAYGAGSLQANMQRLFDGTSGLLVGAADTADTAGNAGYTPVLTIGTVNSVAPVSGTITTTIAGVGTVVVDAASGAFTIDPAPGVTGDVSFPFTVCDAGDGNPVPLCTAAVTASFNIAGPVIWFVDPASLTNGNGTLASPFNTLAAADAVDAANHRIFVYSGTTATGLTLNSGEWLVGRSATGSFDTVFGITPPVGTLARPTLSGGTATIGGTVTLASSAKVQGVAISTGTNAGLVGTGALTGITVSETSVTTTTGTAVNLNGAVGTYSLSSVTTNGAANGILLDSLGNSDVTVTSGAIVSASTRAVDINGGSGNFTLGATITTTGTGRSVEITNHTSGTLSLNGAVSDTGLGVNLDLNTGSTIVFGGTVTASTGANTAFSATGGGTITITGASHTLTTTTGTALNLSGVGGTVRFVSVSTNGAANGILVDNVGSTTVQVDAGSIVGATVRGVDINLGTQNFTYAGSITTSGTGRSVEVTGHTGGTVLFSGSITDNGSGINLSSNTGATLRFTGGITASTGTNPAFAATGGGTVAVTGTNTLTTTTGTALNVANTTIHTDGLTFRSISAGTGASGPTNGIVLSNTGSNGGLTVAGTGSANSGGTIQRTSGAGISLSNTQSPSFTRMLIDNTTGSGIDGTQVTNFSFTNGTISNSGTTGSADTSNIAFNDAASFNERNLSGVVTITGNTFTNAAWHGVDILNYSGTISNATISNNSFTSSTSALASLGSGVRLQALGSAGGTANVTTATLSTNTIVNFPSGAGIIAQGGNTNNAGAPATTFGSVGTPIVIDNNTIHGQSATNRMGTNAIISTLNGVGTGSVTISNNIVSHTAGHSIGFAGNGNVTATFTITNNNVTANQAVIANGISGGAGVTFGTTDHATVNATITGNTITNSTGSGILAVATGAAGQLNAKIQNNNVSAPGTAFYSGIEVWSGNSNSTGDKVCLNISGNTTAGNATQGIGLRRQSGSSVFSVHQMAATATPGVEAYVSGLNPSGNNTVLISQTAGFSSCNLP